MPIHDWCRVRAGKFHHFHNSWIYKLSDCLNGEVLPAGFYAAGEQIACDVEPDVLLLEQAERSSQENWRTAEGVVAIEETPPRVSYVVEAAETGYSRKQDHVTIRASDSDRIVALIEIVSQANKSSRARLDQFLKKIAAALDAGYHLLVIDVHPPGSLDRQGIHAAIWEYLFGDALASVGNPLPTLVSYRAEPITKAFVEPIPIGAALPDMPLFLDADFYVNAPLEKTYMQAWAGFPEPWKKEMIA